MGRSISASAWVECGPCGAFLCGVCVFSRCLRAFHSGVPVSHTNKNMFISRDEGECVCECECWITDGNQLMATIGVACLMCVH